MKLVVTSAAALLLGGCSLFGGSGNSSAPAQSSHDSSVRTVNGKQCPKVWTRVRCSGKDAQCIDRQMDQMELYTQCHKRR